MNRVIRDPELRPATFIGQRPSHILDRELAELIEEARREGYEAGFRDGLETGRSDLDTATARVTAALRNATDAARQLARETVAESMGAAFSIAEFVVGGLGPTQQQTLTHRIRDALERLDDTHLSISVSAEDWEMVSDSLSLLDVDVRQDPSARPGEALIRGRWSSVALTTEAAFAVARDVLT